MYAAFARVIPQQWVAELERSRSNSTKRDSHTTNTRLGSEVINQDRHRLLNTPAVGIAAAVAAGRLKAIRAPAALNFDHFCDVFLRIYDRNDYDRISLFNCRAGGFRCFFATE